MITNVVVRLASVSETLDGDYEFHVHAELMSRYPTAKLQVYSHASRTTVHAYDDRGELNLGVSEELRDLCMSEWWQQFLEDKESR